MRSGGDARIALGALERAAALAATAASTSPPRATRSPPGLVRYDRAGDQHYDTISAWIKATRGSDPDASLYYLATMLEGGEDPRFIARRMVILASEDIGNADPQALVLAVAAAAGRRARRPARVHLRARAGRDPPRARARSPTPPGARSAPPAS